jgi:hypothetical protein
MTSVLRGIYDARMNLPPGAVFTGDPSHCPTSHNFPLPQEAARYRRSASFHDFVNKLLVVKSASSKAGTQFHKNIADQDSLSSYGPIISANRQVQTQCHWLIACMILPSADTVFPCILSSRSYWLNHFDKDIVKLFQ